MKARNTQIGRFTGRLACGAAALWLLSSCGGGDATPTEAAPQNISIAALGKQSLGTAPPALLATTSSGLAVSWVSNSTAVCTVSGNSLTLLAVGTCSLTASQAGSAGFAPAAPVLVSFEVAQGNQSITFVSPGNQVYSSTPIPLVANASSGLAVAFESSTPNVCTVAGTALTLRALGTCSISARQPGNSNFAAAPAVSNSFSVAAAMAAQVITFSPLGNVTLGAAPVPLVATASSGLPVIFASTTSALCTVNGNLLTLLGAGTCTVVASQAGDLLFAGAAAVSQNVTVLPTAQSINFVSPGNQRLGSTTALLLATASSGLTVTVVSNTPAVCSVNTGTGGTSLALVAVGSCTLSASQAGDARFAPAASVQQTFQVAAALLAQTITFNTPGGQTLGTAAPALVASASSGLAVTVVSGSPAVCSVSGNTLNLLAVGTCSLSASQAGNTTFLPAQSVSVSFAVAAAPVAQTITFSSPGAQRLGTPPAALVASSSAGLVVSFASNTTAVCSTGNGNANGNSTLTLLAAGTCSITASQAGNSTYAAATPVTVSFNVTAALQAQSISFATPGAQRLGTATAPLVASATSGLAVSLTSTTPGVCSTSGSTLTLLAAGSCSITASQAGDTTYAAAAPVSNSFAVAAAFIGQSISFTSPGNLRLGSAPPALVASASSGLPVTFSSGSPSVCTATGSSLNLFAAGQCVITANQAGNATYSAAPPVLVSFIVSAAPVAQTISFASPGNQTLGVPPAALLATATSGLAVVFNTLTPNVCATSGVNGSSLALLGVGNCTLSASQNGNGTYAAAAPVAVTFVVSAAMLAQSISFAPLGDQRLGVAAPALLASATSGLPVTVISTTPATCTASGNTLVLLAVGSCTLTASQPGNAAYSAAQPVSQTLQIAPALLAQTINFVSPGAQTLGTAPGPLVAASTSGLAVVFSSTTNTVCTTSGNVLTLLTAGMCSITASQPGNALYAPAAPVSNTFAVAPAPGTQFITFASPGNQTLGTAAPALLATASSGLTVTFSSSTGTVCTVSGTSLNLLAVGTCTVTASQAGNASFTAAPPVSISFAVNAAPIAQLITFASPGPQTLGVAPAPLAAASNSGLLVVFSSNTAVVCGVSGNTLTLLAAGTCSITASQAGNATYAAATPVTNSFNVAPAPLVQSISFASPGNQRLGTAPPALVATASSGLVVSFVSTTAGVCSTSGSTLTLLATGTCSITASQAGNATYAAAAPVSNSFTVSPALLVQSITFASPGNQRLGTAPPALAATASSGLVVSFVSTTAGVCSASGSTLTLLATGTCSITASQAGNAVYAAAADVSNSFTVSPALLVQSITFASPGNQRLNTAPPALAATASSGLVVSFVSTTAGVCSTSGSTLTLLATGTCSITASQAGNAVYAAAADVSNSFTVSPALLVQSITFASPGNQRLGTAPPALAATASSGLVVSFVSTTAGVCSTSGSTLTLLATGTCSITASQAGNAVYAAAADVSNSFTVSAALLAQSITFVNPGSQTLGTTPGALVAVPSSGLTATLVSTTPAVCSATGSSLTLLSAGTCSITASQAGNAVYAAAAPVSISFSVLPAPLAQTITFVSPSSQTLGTTPGALVATASSGLTVSFVSTTPGVCTTSGSTLTLVAVGTCSITASQAGNAIYAAAAAVSLSFAVNAAPVVPVELIANGGFEAAPTGAQIAFGWRGAGAVPATVSNDARSGTKAGAMVVPAPGFAGSVLLQNSVDDGGRPSMLGLYVGKTTTLTFWAKGSAGATGDLGFSLRYLDGVGNILAQLFNVSFVGQVNPNTWTRLSYTGPAIPAQTSAIFLEMTLATGPIGVSSQVLIDDVSVTVLP